MADTMPAAARKFWDFYNMVPGAGLIQREFGFYSLDKWRRDEGLAPDADLDALFGFDPPGRFGLGALGWCEAGFDPIFTEEVIEDRGDYEIVRDFAGRSVLFFKGRRNGFMPEYVDHPVKDKRTWEELCKWRMDPKTPSRQKAMDEYLPKIAEKARQGYFISQNIVGGYMYLRSLIGPEELLYMVYDNPELVHDCMKTWFELADNIIARHQQVVEIDEIFIGEDICYNHGPLISPDMIREFLFPYYSQLLENASRRQPNHPRKMGFEVDTDGFCNPVIDLYREIGMNYMNPFEVASNCDVVEIGKQYPDLLMSGGIDKRVLAQGKDAIDRMVDRIFPVMKARGGFIPTCDHGVPEEVTLENYLHYRKRALEFK